MSGKVICFGEILWDCLPRGLFLGGAPFNVAYHLQLQKLEPIFVSAVGDDFLGDEALHRVRRLGLPGDQIQICEDLPTGYVRVELDAQKNASYTIAEPVAWDRIVATNSLLDEAGDAAVVYGSLAQRREHNREQLSRLLDAAGSLKIMDVNLRPPHDDPEIVLELASRADVVKLNEEEAHRLSGCPASESLEQCAQQLSSKTGVKRICVTRGGDGAFYWSPEGIVEATTPNVEVADTVGAGDAFMSALVRAQVEGKANNLEDAVWLENACRIGAYVASQEGATPDYDPEQV